MPKRTDIKTILVLGSGPIVIGQGCEFDYSGTQACKSLKDEGYRIVLVNSNPATIMTDPQFSDRTYIEPITPEAVRKIIENENKRGPRIDAILPTLGGQTALNCACKLFDNGTLQEFGIEMIGANREVIHRAEDRQVFKDICEKIGLILPKAKTVTTLDDAFAFLEEIGLPAIIRPAFTLGGTGGGIAYNREEFREICTRGLMASMIGQIQIDQSVIGWKEFELEVVRDKKDNCIIVCGIENIDAMGVHTGDSITVAPILTLTDKEYQAMRDAAFAVMRAVGVETGGSNVQFAVNPSPSARADGSKPFEMVVVEMNPRVSRSSALASKATGFPIAKIAAKLAIGYTLDELKNDITGTTSACFEPTIDYVVTKMPRWTFEKFPEADETLTTQMKSVGEAMAIGRTFKESLQKVIRSMDVKRFGLGLDRNDKWLTAMRAVEHGQLVLDVMGASQEVTKRPRDEGTKSGDSHSVTLSLRHSPTSSSPTGLRTADGQLIEWPIAEDKLSRKLAVPSQGRLYYVRYAFKMGWSIEKVHALTKYDHFFLDQILQLVEFEDTLCDYKRLEDVPANVLFEAKQFGYSDAQLANLYLGTITIDTILQVREHRKRMGIEPVYKLVDTCAAEFEAKTPYYYSTYERSAISTTNPRGAGVPPASTPPTSSFRGDDEIRITDKKKVIILGGGPNRIGQGIEFDYCCCHAAYAAKELGFESVMINSNPETVSTDYDTSDLLFFEPLTLEDTLNVIERLNGCSLAAPQLVDLSSTVGPGGTQLSTDWIQRTRLSLARDTKNWTVTTSQLSIEVPADLFSQISDACKSHKISRMAFISASAAKQHDLEFLSVEGVDGTGQIWRFRFPAGVSPRLQSVEKAEGPQGQWKNERDDIEPEYTAGVDHWIASGSGLVHGIIVQFGGQTPLNLAKGLVAAGAPIIGTSVDSIDRAEDRNRFDEVLEKLKLHRPPAGIARSVDEAVAEANRIGYPVLLRPSYVLGGRGMEICPDEKALRNFIDTALRSSALDEAPVLIDKFLDGATEVDVDVVADFGSDEVTGSSDEATKRRSDEAGKSPSAAAGVRASMPSTSSLRHSATPSLSPQALVAGIMEQIEQAGIHSGDSACTLPPASLSADMQRRIADLARGIAAELRVCGLMNIQLAVKDDKIYVLEVNPRASRTVPFVSKATHVPWPALAAKAMMGKSLAELGAKEVPLSGRYAIKESVFPFSKFPGVDVVLGPEMRSTGEVMGLDRDLAIAFAKSQMAAGADLPTDPSKGGVFVSVRLQDRPIIVEPIRSLIALGFKVYATEGTAAFLAEQGVKPNVLQKIGTGARPNVLDLMNNREIALIINTPTRTGWKTDEGKIRSTAVRLNIPMITTSTAAVAAVKAIEALRARGWGVAALQDYK